MRPFLLTAAALLPLVAPAFAGAQAVSATGTGSGTGTESATGTEPGTETESAPGTGTESGIESAAMPGTVAVDARVVPLAQLEQLALQERHALAADAAQLRVADAEIERARSASRPRVGLEARGSMAPGRQLVQVEALSGETYRVSGVRAIDEDDAFLPQVRYGVELELKHNLYDFGRTAATVQAARAQRATAQARRDVTAERLLGAVRAGYVEWLAAAELHDIAQRVAGDARARRERVEALIAEGARPAAELSPARAEEMLAQLELQRAAGALAESRLALSQAVGTPLPDDALPDRALLDAPAVDGGEPAAGERASLRALELQRDAEQAAARAHEKDSAPVLAGLLSAGVHAQNDTPFPSYAVGLSLQVPLYDGGAASARASAARARAQAIAATLAERSQHLQDGRALAVQAHDQASAQLQAAAALLEVSRARVAEAEQAYELGAGGLESIARATAMLHRAQTEVVLAKVARATARLQLR